jgi:glycosyltransferase involved in cell wall biosynthesis
MKKVYATHANSVLLYNELKSMHNFPFYVPNGVDVDLFYEKTSILSDHDEPIFGHVGKKGKMKNQSTILEPAVKKANVKYYPHYNDYTNKISHDKMVDIHQNYDVLLIASSEDATPNSFLEASACGRMTIGNKIGNLPEFIVDG